MTSPASSAANPWTSYLDRFHEHRPGITEDVLSEACDVDGTNPYAWLLAVVPRNPGAVALDLACGSGPLQIADSHLRWVGVDRSPGELARAGSATPRMLVRGDAQRQPFQDATFDLVACSMALMLFNPVDAVVAEICRVLRQEGTLILLLPGSLPHSTRDRVRYVRLLAALREIRPAYPTRVHLGRLRARLERAGFAVVSDERRCFRYSIRDEHYAQRFVDSLYLPGRSPERAERAARAARSWVGSTIGIPLRRVVCGKNTESASARATR
ncbi:MAG: class I SAM-dependent methyltransferase [Actinomycetota bacterium]|nr:class I SAM-dependent methyltransferase [Actinomycetota bacterium]